MGDVIVVTRTPVRIAPGDISLRLMELFTQATRAEVRARTSPVTSDGPEFYQVHLDLVDEMRELLFGTSNVYELAERFGFTTNERKK